MKKAKGEADKESQVGPELSGPKSWNGQHSRID